MRESAFPRDDPLLFEDRKNVGSEAVASGCQPTATFGRIGDRLSFVVDDAVALGHQGVDRRSKIVVSFVEPGGEDRGVEIAKRHR